MSKQHTPLMVNVSDELLPGSECTIERADDGRLVAVYEDGLRVDSEALLQRFRQSFDPNNGKHLALWLAIVEGYIGHDWKLAHPELQAILRAQRQREEMGGVGNIFAPWPPKPAGMSLRRFAAIWDREVEIVEAAHQALLDGMRSPGEMTQLLAYWTYYYVARQQHLAGLTNGAA